MNWFKISADGLTYGQDNTSAHYKAVHTGVCTNMSRNHSFFWVLLSS